MGVEPIEKAQEYLRMYLKDTPQYNKLLGGKYENEPAFLRHCILYALNDWNSTPPPIASVGLTNHPSKYLLIEGAALIALRSAGIWHSRERMPSSDGGTSADDHAKYSEYQGWIQQQYADYERKKLDIKKSINMANAFGDFASEYAGYRYSGEGLW